MQNASRTPKHVAIIMDGNGRWATARGLSRTEGHARGEKTAQDIILAAQDLGVETLSLYCFSTENWKRPQGEVSFLLELLKRDLEEEQAFYMNNNIRLIHLGSMQGLPLSLQIAMKAAVHRTRNNTGIRVAMAFNYGGRDEIIRTVMHLPWIERFKLLFKPRYAQTLSAFSKQIAMHDGQEIGDVDMLIRTGGDLRLSNFLLWQSAYAELFFSSTLWPDFTKEELAAMISQFGSRDRRFGGLK